MSPENQPWKSCPSYTKGCIFTAVFEALKGFIRALCQGTHRKACTLTKHSMHMGGTGFAGGYPSRGFASQPVTRPQLYNPAAPAGERWSALLADSHVPRLYHSTIMLLPTGEVQCSQAASTDWSLRFVFSAASRPENCTCSGDCSAKVQQCAWPCKHLCHAKQLPHSLRCPQ